MLGSRLPEIWLLLLEQGKLTLVRDNRAEHAQDSRQLLFFAYIRRLGGDCMTQPIDGRFIHNSNGLCQGLPPAISSVSWTFYEIPPYSRGRRNPNLPTGTCRSLRKVRPTTPTAAQAERIRIRHRGTAGSANRRMWLDLTTYARLSLALARTPALARARAVPLAA